MRILAEGRVYLEAGERVPVWCPCGETYQPREGEQLMSRCPTCKATNLHEGQRAEAELMH